MRKIIIRTIFGTIAIAVAFLVFGSGSTSKPVPCEESLEQCCKKKTKDGSDRMIIETLSGQFFTFSGSY